MTDSSATFKSRATLYGLPSAALASLEQDGICTYSSLLFSVVSSPGSLDDVRLKALKSKHLSPNVGEEAAFSRLVFEAGIFVVAELRSTVVGEDETARRLTPDPRPPQTFPHTPPNPKPQTPRPKPKP